MIFFFFLILDTCAILRASQKKTTVEEDQCTHRNPHQKNHHLNNLLRNLGHEARPPKARRRTAAPATGKTFAQVARFTYMKVVKFVEFIKFRSVLFFVRLISASWILRCVLCVHSSSLMADGANSARRDISNRFFFGVMTLFTHARRGAWLTDVESILCVYCLSLDADGQRLAHHVCGCSQPARFAHDLRFGGRGQELRRRSRCMMDTAGRQECRLPTVSPTTPRGRPGGGIRGATTRSSSLDCTVSHPAHGRH